jgi:hypothetical protein
MTDILERLRDNTRDSWDAEIMDDAAREIERLRAELQNCQNKLKTSGRAKLRDALTEANQKIAAIDAAMKAGK